VTRERSVQRKPLEMSRITSKCEKQIDVCEFLIYDPCVSDVCLCVCVCVCVFSEDALTAAEQQLVDGVRSTLDAYREQVGSLEEVFSNFDADENGTLSYVELRQVLAEMDMYPDEDVMVRETVMDGEAEVMSHTDR